MKKIFVFAVLAALVLSHALTGKTGTMVPTASDPSFPLVSGEQVAVLIMDDNEALVVHKAGDMLSNDLREITGKALRRGNAYNKKTEGPVILAATVGSTNKKSLLNTLSKQVSLPTKELEGKWESFKIQTVRINGEKVLLILGSDRRGTAYGILELSRLMGVSPWTWWADVHPEKRADMVLENPNTNMKSPSVAYRGIFLNDEDWGLHPWAGQTFEPEVGDIGPKTYGKLFELLLRLRCNTIWPAMHECTKPFFTIPGNMDVADTFAIMISNSHCEPMLRTNTGEWNQQEFGAYNYFSNRERVYKYWEDRIIETKHAENIYTIGMRGIHDGRMEGASTVESYKDGLTEVIRDQRNILSQHINPNLSEVHQIFIPYKEVQEVYDAGLDVPEDVTLIWCDDNYGYIRRLSNAQEQKRSGGSGVYYHISYWGRPHDYLWIASSEPSAVWYEMQRAWAYGARKMWILNVGDLKPAEYLTEFFMDMAWNINSIAQASVRLHLRTWFETIFGKETGRAIAQVMDRYYGLSFIRRPEFMGWSQTEPTTKTSDSEFNPFEMGDELQDRIAAHLQLDSMVQTLRPQIPERLQDAYFELVEYPVRGAALMNSKQLYAQMARMFNQYGIRSASSYAEKSQAAYQEIEALTETYNTRIANGKWNRMMSMNPRNLPVFDAPTLPEQFSPSSSAKLWIEGNREPTVPYVERRKSETTGFIVLDHHDRFVRIYDAESITWISKPIWLKLIPDEHNDIRTGEMRFTFALDERKMQAAMEGGLVEVRIDNKTYRIAVEAIKPPIQREAFEEDQAVIIPVGNFTQRNDGTLKWKEVDGLGYSRHAIAIFPLQYTLNQEDPQKNPYLEYTFYTTSSGVADVRLYFLPTHPADGKSDLRYAVSLDDDALQTCSIRTYDRDDQWKKNVLRNQAISVSQHVVTPGHHALRIYPVDPGLVLDQIMIDFKKDRSFYAVPVKD